MELIQPHIKDKSVVIWDWNGTLLNDIQVCVEVINSMLADHQLPAISKEQYQDHFCFPIRKYYSSIGFDYSKTPFEVIADQFIHRYEQRLHECSLFEGAKDLLSVTGQPPRRQFILSAAKETLLRELIEKHSLGDFLTGVYGLVDNYATSKIDRGRQLLADFAINPRDAILVGDTDHDLEVGRAMGVEVLLLGDGHQHPTRLGSLNSLLLSSRYRLT